MKELLEIKTFRPEIHVPRNQGNTEKSNFHYRIIKPITKLRCNNLEENCLSLLSPRGEGTSFE